MTCDETFREIISPFGDEDRAEKIFTSLCKLRFSYRIDSVSALLSQVVRSAAVPCRELLARSTEARQSDSVVELFAVFPKLDIWKDNAWLRLPGITVVIRIIYY